MAKRKLYGVIDTTKFDAVGLGKPAQEISVLVCLEISGVREALGDEDFQEPWETILVKLQPGNAIFELVDADGSETEETTENVVVYVDPNLIPNTDPTTMINNRAILSQHAKLTHEIGTTDGIDTKAMKAFKLIRITEDPQPPEPAEAAATGA